MNKLIVLLLLCGFINGVYAKDSTEITQEEFITKILNQQVKQQISLKRSVSSILSY